MASSTLDILNEFSLLDELSRTVLQEFSKTIIENKFFIYKNYLLEDADIVEFKNEWNFNPQKCALDKYSNKFLYPIILLANNSPSIFTFHIDNYTFIKIPQIDKIEYIAFNY